MAESTKPRLIVIFSLSFGRNSSIFPIARSIRRPSAWMEYGWSDAAYKVVLKNFSKGISWGKPKGKLSRSYRN